MNDSRITPGEGRGKSGSAGWDVRRGSVVRQSPDRKPGSRRVRLSLVAVRPARVVALMSGASLVTMPRRASRSGVIACWQALFPRHAAVPVASPVNARSSREATTIG